MCFQVPVPGPMSYVTSGKSPASVSRRPCRRRTRQTIEILSADKIAQVDHPRICGRDSRPPREITEPNHDRGGIW